MAGTTELHHRPRAAPPSRGESQDPGRATSISPHSLRHTFITESLAAGVPLQDVQDAGDIADPRTTRRYDHTRLVDDHHPTYKLVAYLRREQNAGDDAPARKHDARE